MRALTPKTRIRVAAVLASACSVLFVFQIIWLSVLTVEKVAQGTDGCGRQLPEVRTDILFFLSILLSVVATGVNDWGWHRMAEFRRRLPTSITLIVVLILAIGAKTEAIRSNGSSGKLIPWLDMVQSTIWLLFLGGGVRLWHMRNGKRTDHPLLSRNVRRVMIVKLSGLCVLWLYQAFQLMRGDGLRNWAAMLSDGLYLMGMCAAWLSYMERRSKFLWHGILGATEECSSNETAEKVAAGGREP